MRIATLMIWLAIMVLSSCTTPVNPGNNPNPISTDLGDTNALPGNITLGAATGTSSQMLAKLVTEIEQMQQGEPSLQRVYAVDFESYRQEFGVHITKNTADPQANLGYIISALLALNSNDEVVKIIDSIDTYLQDVQNSSYLALGQAEAKSVLSKKPHASGPLMRSFISLGLMGFSRHLATQMPAVAKATVANPSFPSWLKMSTIQDAVEEHILPVLTELIAACKRLEAQDSVAIEIFVEGSTYEIDIADVYLVDSAVRLTRALLQLFMAYDLNVRNADGEDAMDWLDSLQLYESLYEEDSVQKIISLSGDTLYETTVYYPGEFANYIGRMLQANLADASFGSLRREVHASIHTDLLSSLDLLSAAVESMRSETDAQHDDLFPLADLFQLDSDMLDLSEELVDEGVSLDLAAHFSSLEDLIAFLQSLLQQPYDIQETINDQPFELRIDFSAWFRTPVENIRMFLPRYKTYEDARDMLVYENEYHYAQPQTYYSVSQYYGNQSVEIQIPGAQIDTLVDDFFGDQTYEITTPKEFVYVSEQDYLGDYFYWSFIDEAGQMIHFSSLTDMFRSAEDLQKNFPTFTDYTFGGFFPELTTRQDWVDLIAPYL